MKSKFFFLAFATAIFYSSLGVKSAVADVSSIQTFDKSDGDRVLQAAQKGNAQYVLDIIYDFDMNHPQFPKEQIFQIARERGLSWPQGVNLVKEALNAAMGGDWSSDKRGYNALWGLQRLRLMAEAGFGPKHPDFPLTAVFQIARDYGRSEIVKWLAANGVDIVFLSRSPFTILADQYRPKQWDNSLAGAVRGAILGGDIEGIRWLVLGRGVDINQPIGTDTQTALHYMAIYYDYEDQPYKAEVLQALFDLGADPGQKDHLGRTVLDTSIHHKTLDFAKKIIDSEGVNPSRSLLSVVRRGDVEAMQFMAQAGFGVNHPGHPLRAVFQTARSYGHPQAIEWLAANGVDTMRLSRSPIRNCVALARHLIFNW